MEIRVNIMKTYGFKEDNIPVLNFYIKIYAIIMNKLITKNKHANYGAVNYTAYKIELSYSTKTPNQIRNKMLNVGEHTKQIIIIQKY